MLQNSCKKFTGRSSVALTHSAQSLPAISCSADFMKKFPRTQKGGVAPRLFPDITIIEFHVI
jgi:hypothetical protein